MLRRQFLAGLTAVPLAFAADRPNIILAMADDLGWGDTHYNGHPTVQTPHLDAMSRAGIRFDRFYSGAPVCSPTRGSCLTGRHPYRYGIFFANADSGTDAPSQYILPARETTIAEVLRPLGYATGHFGKWHLGDFSGPKQSSPSDNGFDEYFSTIRKVPTVNPDGYWSNGERIRTPFQGDDSKILMDRALAFIEKSTKQKKPFFAVIWFHAPHEPVLATDEHRARYRSHAEKQQHFWGAVTALDEQMGRLRDSLKQWGVARDTMLWFASDNGPEGDKQDPNQSPGSAGPWRGRKRSLFEGGVRVPGILEWPARYPKPFVMNAAASTSDYFPTVLSAVGQRSNQPVLDGVNLLPLLDKRKPNRGVPIAFETMGQTLAATRGSPRLAWIEDRFKLLSNLQDAAGDLLFDLNADPKESTNVVAQFPAEHQRMRKSLASWRAAVTTDRER